jgi:sulfur carrier protein
MKLTINGHERDFPALSAPATVESLIENLGLKGDRVAIELNGEIAARTGWTVASLAEGDKLEIVHFVGGG